ncbi:hypothetical protein C922_05825 [Plasmodium inui San Antonio 1]|uniref:Uncharacterized protein n=1 Tax=Plasmodium inui San Antonio 1 TaxID=1237626 RepID=W7A3Y4_9APIC|nr:hypothetical protein C922_05825 [Plasmodium inui San Antonio 1]EUD63794.1 hypothetical protein C922_05825 [Plasmodium inui San Antonio 1]
MAEAVLSLKADKALWEIPGHAAGQASCPVGQSRYCIGAYSAGGGAVRGFLGQWRSHLLGKSEANLWHQLTGKAAEEVSSLLKNGRKRDEWKGILSCVMYEALNTETIMAEADEGKKILWRRGNWQKVLSRGIGSQWDRSADGQNMLVALACIIAGLLGWEPGKQLPDIVNRLKCREVWRLVALGPRRHESLNTKIPIKDLSSLIKGAAAWDADTDPSESRLGLLLSIYNGLTKCVEYNRHYDLTALIDDSDLQMSEIGPCTLDGTQLRCGETAKARGQGSLNLWKKTTQRLSRGLLEKVTPPSKVKIVEKNEGPSGGQERETTASNVGARLQKYVEAARNCTGGAVGGKDPCAQQMELVKSRNRQEQMKEQQETDLGGKEGNGRSESSESLKVGQGHTEGVRIKEQGDLLSSLPVGDERKQSETADRQNSAGEPGAQPPVQSQVSDVEDHERQDSIVPDLVADSVNSASDGVNLSGIIGGVLATLLALGGVYGIYRILTKRSRTKRPTEQSMARNFGRGLKYG